MRYPPPHISLFQKTSNEFPKLGGDMWNFKKAHSNICFHYKDNFTM